MDNDLVFAKDDVNDHNVTILITSQEEKFELKVIKRHNTAQQ